MLRRLRCQVLPKLGSTAGPRALSTKPVKSPNEPAMGSGRLKHRINIVPSRILQSSLEAPRRVLGGLQNRLPKGPKSNPEGAKMASWRPLWGFWAQVAAKAALRPHVGGSCGPLGGSWGRLGAPLAPLGALLGLPRGSPEARWGAPGGHFGTYFEGRPREPGKSQCFGISSGLVASTFAAVFGRLLPSLWRARRRRVP